ncbi:PspC domain-containing protein [Paenibacillus sp.]|uniref:PspC domain-containing protein n=1 Tax=Paenibacillus sp. TaxID=58172 RepID=UPI002D648FA6|nr:PspC domain-containing protein [Paenibacillus sp.]HZG56532.1 PspC domain-containing protein [Paenibacillus sp.]
MKRVYRSVRDRKLFGVCGGLAEATGIDATILRIVLVVAAVFSGGAPIPIYIIAAMVMPKDPTYGPSFGADGSPYGSRGSMHWNEPPPQPWGAPPPPPRPQQPAGYGQTAQGYYPPSGGAKAPSIDDLMEDIEKKAMSKEIEALKAKLAQYEKGQKGDD